MRIHPVDDVFSSNLRHLRKKHHMSQTTLARLVCMDINVLRGIENGILYPSIPLPVFQKMCQVFHIPSQALATKYLSASERP